MNLEKEWNSDIITLIEINDLIKDLNFDSNTEFKCQLYIEAQEIDELVFGHLLNLCLEFPNSKFEIYFKNKPEILIKLPNYLFYSNLSFPSGQIRIFNYRGYEIFTTPKVPSTYFPTLLVRSQKEKIPLDLNHSKKASFLDQLKNDSTKDQFANLNDLSYNTVKSILDILDILKYIKNPSAKNKTGRLDETNSKIVFNEIEKLLRNMKFFEFSISQIFIFNAILKNSDLKDHIKELRKNNTLFNRSDLIIFITKLKNWLQFVTDIESGISQINQNIIEHSGNLKNKGSGVYAGRVHRFNDFKLKKDLNTSLKTYLNRQTNVTNLLEINFLDHGKKGLRNSYIQNLEYNILGEDSLGKALFIKDLDLLKNSEDFNLGHFFDFLDQRLGHQSTRAIGRFGLMIFAQQILKNKEGFLLISSYDTISENLEAFTLYFADNKIVHSEIEEKELLLSCVKKGLNISAYIPLKYSNRVDESDLNTSIDTSKSLESSIFKQLVNYKEITKNETQPIANELNKEVYYSQNEVQKIEPGVNVLKYSKHKYILDQLIDNQSQIKVLDAEELSIQFCFRDFSDWLRFFGQYNLNYHDKFDLILTGFNQKTLVQLITFCKDLPTFFNTIKPILIYVKVEHKFDDDYERLVENSFFKRHSTENRSTDLWFNFVLGGDTYENCLAYNLKISQYHHNMVQLLKFNPETIPIDNNFHSYLFHEKKLLNFELLIRHGGSTNTIFVESVESLLNLEIESQFQDLNRKKYLSKKSHFFQRFKGHKISNSHFKLGSKIHIKDFYYAKRMFYNGFYTTRFAFLIARDILIQKVIDLDDEVSIIGNGHHSELLVNSLRQFLNTIGYKNLNHDVLLENGKILKNRNNLKDNFLLVIPISCTFSTSDRMVSNLKSIKAYINEKAIVNKTIYSPLWITDESNTTLLADLSIQIINEKDIQAYDRTHRISLKLQTKWYSNFTCQLCNYDDSDNEICLLETEPNGVTPNIDFALPKFKEITFKNFPFILNRNSVIKPKMFNEQNNLTYFEEVESKNDLFISTQFVKKVNNNSYSFFRTGRFLKTLLQRRGVFNLEGLKKDLKKLQFDENKEIVFVSPSISSNSGFINIVNDVISNGTSTVLKFNPTEDTLNNFSKFHASVLENKTIIYVDDVISSSNSFFEIAKYVLRTANKKFDFSISLLNRMSFDEYYIYLQYFNFDIKKCYSFLKLNFPNTVKSDRKELGNRFYYYQRLSKRSSLDLIRSYFIKKAIKAKPKDLDTFGKEVDTEIKDLFQTLVLQEITMIFQVKLNTNKTSFNAELDDISHFSEKENIIDYILKKLEKNDLLDVFYDKFPIYKSDVELTVGHLLTEPTFINSVFLKKDLFNWIYSELNKFIERDIDANFFEPRSDQLYSEYQKFKFLSKIAAKLRINLLLSIKALKFIEKVLLGISNLSLNSSRKTIFPIGFTTFYVSLIQELVNDDEAKAYILIKNIYKISKENESNYCLRNNDETEFINFMRILVVENIYSLETFTDDLNKTIDSEASFKFFPDELNKTVDNEASFKFFSNALTSLLNTPRYKATNNSLIDFRNHKLDEKLISAFKHTAFTKYVLQKYIDNKFSSDGLLDKLKLVLEHIFKSFTADYEKVAGGCFVAFNQGHTKSGKIDNTDLYLFDGYFTDKEHKFEKYIYEDSIIVKIINGIGYDGGKSFRTSFELNYNSDKCWNFKKEGILPENVKNLQNAIYLEDANEKKYKNYFFIRLGALEISDEKEEPLQKPSAVLGFYFNPLNETNESPSKMVSPKYIRFLLLIRDELQAFIKNEMENEGFNAMVDIEKKDLLKSQSQHGWDKHFLIAKKLLEEGNWENIQFQGWLKTWVYFLSNKSSLIKYLSTDKGNMHTRTISISDIKELISDLAKNIFTLETDHYDIKSSDYNLIFEFDDLTTKIAVFEPILNEIIFEVFYNIKKHVIHSQKYKFHKNDVMPIPEPLEVKIGIDRNYLYIQNNHCYKKINEEKYLKAEKIHGLAQANKLCKDYLNFGIKISVKNECFRIEIPITNTLL